MADKGITPLGSNERVGFDWAQTTAPWSLPVDAITISTGTGLGDLGRALRARFPEGWAALDLAAVQPGRPQTFTVGDGKAQLAAVCVTLHDDPLVEPGPGEALRNIARAGADAVRGATAIGARVLAIPLLGAGALFQEPKQVAAALVPAVLDAAEESSLVRVVLFGRLPDEIDAIEQAWRKARPQRLAGGSDTDLVDPERGIPLEEDQLGVGVYAEMLAAVIADKDTRLPLSVGLFGEWGSGKSSFMGLLRQQVSDRSADGPPYLPNIVQIGFNAWSYADSNLWASLGDEIFRELAGLDAKQDAERQRQIDALRAALAEGGERAEELRRADEKAKQRTAELKTELDLVRRERTSAIQLLLQAAPSELDAIWKRLGIRDAVDQGHTLVDQLRGRQSDPGRWQALSGLRGYFLVAGTVLSGLLVLAGLLATDQVRGWLAGFGATGLLTVITLVTTYLARARLAMGQLTGFARRFNNDLARRDRAEVDGALDEIRASEAREQVVRQQLDEVQVTAAELGRQLADLAPGRRLYSFLAERDSSLDYRGRLGLISLIRKDFEQLAGLMKGWKPEQHDETERPIDRIVLYIDDLDRCSPEQVVAVLQAVHLLLALDLFVVVVGVDPRWLLHSLRHQYRSILRAREPGAVGTVGGGPWQSTPQDYLEKIFNVPFVLPGMTTTGFGAMIRHLSAPRQPMAGKGAADGALAGEHAAQAPTSGTALAGTAATGTAPMGSAPSGSAGKATVQAGSEIDRTRHGRLVQPQPLAERELVMLAALAPLVRSPRETKRLLNLYRMLRSTQNLSEQREFLGPEGEHGEYQAVAVLLGLLSARPALLGQLLTAPADEQHGVPGGICVRTDEGAGWAEVVDGLRPHRVEESGRFRNDVAAQLTDAEAGQWQDLLERAGAATALVTLPDLAAFRYWGQHIARFSFALAAPPTVGATVVGPTSVGRKTV